MLSRAGAILIASLCVVLAALLSLMAAPARRGQTAVIAVPLLVAALALAVAAVRMRPSPRGQPIGRVIADPDGFIASVDALSREFHAWAAAKGRQANDELQVLELACKYGEQFLDEHPRLTAIAAYGEALRRAMNGRWMISRTRPGRELVVARPGRPWTRRRVVYEVMDALSR